MSDAHAWQHPVLRPGQHLRVIAPAGPFDLERFERGLARLRQHYEVSHDVSLFARQGYLAGSDARRLQELQEALADDSVHGLIAARGGYGSTRLLDDLEPEQVARSGKLLIGFSDITALHALWARAQVGSVHGPMVAGLSDVPDGALDACRAVWAGEAPAAVEGLQVLVPGQARGRLLGGNLAVLLALLGTRHLPSLQGAVLFLEDVGERPYRVDRMLTTLRSAGMLAGLSAVVLGDFSDAAPGADGVQLHQVLAERLGDLGIPVLAGLPAGHRQDNLPLPLGRPVQVDGERGRLAFVDAPAEP